MKKLNLFMMVQWLVFFPLILPLGIMMGAIDGMKKVIEQAKEDIIEVEKEILI